VVAMGLVLLVAAAVIAVAGILANLGSGHPIGRSVDLLGYHLTGSTGKLLLVGVVLGVVGMLGLSLLLAGLRHGMRRRSVDRRERKAVRREAGAVMEDRDRLADRLELEHAARVQAENSTPTGAVAGSEGLTADSENV
jgi:hypothetical protein